MRQEKIVVLSVVCWCLLGRYGYCLDGEPSQPDGAIQTPAPTTAPGDQSGEPAIESGDEAFDRFVDLRAVGRALQRLDAAGLADAALQLTEAERVLARVHRGGLSAAQLCQLAVKTAAACHDRTTLARLGVAAKREGNKTLAAEIETLLHTTGESRDPAANWPLPASDADCRAFPTYQEYVEGIMRARLLGDRQSLASIGEALGQTYGLSSAQVQDLDRRITAARGELPDKPPIPAETWRKLAGAERGVFDSWWPSPLRVDFQVLVKDQPLKKIVYQGNTYVAAPGEGAEYQIKVRNLGPRRILAIVSVDGLSVMNGEKASEKSAGYVIGPSQEYVIKGWRRGNKEVAAFYFTAKKASYAEATGRPEGIGAIGLIAVEEWTPPPHPAPRMASGGRRAAVTSAPGRWPAAETSLGTGYGKSVESKVVTVQFRRGSKKLSETLHYETEENLKKAGVTNHPPTAVEPAHVEGPFTPPPPETKERK